MKQTRIEDTHSLFIKYWILVFYYNCVHYIFPINLSILYYIKNKLFLRRLYQLHTHTHKCVLMKTHNLHLKSPITKSNKQKNYNENIFAFALCAYTIFIIWFGYYVVVVFFNFFLLAIFYYKHKFIAMVALKMYKK